MLPRLSSWRASLILTACLVGSPAQAEESYVDARGRQVAFEPTFESWFGPGRFEPAWARMVGENAGLLAFELFIYWYDPRESVTDWQFPDLASKFGSNAQLSFDDNFHRTNMFLHPFAGGAHYVFTRVNGFGVVPAFASAAVSSGLYEAVFEWRELMSVNDLIVTPFAGMAMGEFAHQLGEYLNSQSRRPRKLEAVIGAEPFGRKLAGGVLGLPRALHGRFNEVRPPVEVEDDSLGFSSAFHHDFSVTAGAELIGNDQGSVGQVAVANLTADVFAMPGFLRPGAFDTWFGSGNFTSMRMRLSTNARVRDFDASFDAHLFGHYAQSIERRREGFLGAAREIGARTTLRYVDRWLLGRRDHFATVELLGPTVTTWLLYGHTRLRLAASIAPHFSQIRSLAFEDWVDERGAGGTKSSLINDNYYSALGATGRATAELSAAGAVLSVGGHYGRYESVDGLERFQSDVLVEPHMSDDVAELEVAMGYDPPETVLSTRLTMAHLARISRMPPYEQRRFDQRVGLAVGARF